MIIFEKNKCLQELPHPISLPSHLRGPPSSPGSPQKRPVFQLLLQNESWAIVSSQRASQLCARRIQNSCPFLAPSVQKRDAWVKPCDTHSSVHAPFIQPFSKALNLLSQENSSQKLKIYAGEWQALGVSKNCTSSFCLSWTQMCT